MTRHAPVSARRSAPQKRQVQRPGLDLHCPHVACFAVETREAALVGLHTWQALAAVDRRAAGLGHITEGRAAVIRQRLEQRVGLRAVPGRVSAQVSSLLMLKPAEVMPS